MTSARVVENAKATAMAVLGHVRPLLSSRARRRNAPPRRVAWSARSLGTQFNLPPVDAWSASIAQLIRAHTIRPLFVTRIAHQTLTAAASSSASAPCFRISRFAARQMSRSEITRY
jgi:hypothetical protein